MIPIPTSVFSLGSSFNLTSNATGNVAFVYNPAYLTGVAFTTFLINNDATLTGSIESDFFKGLSIGQMLPTALYATYRLVSSGVRMTVIAPNLTSAGYVGMGVCFEEDNVKIGNGVVNTAWKKYGDFKLIDGLPNFEGMPARFNDRTIKGIFLPREPSVYNFEKLDVEYAGYSFIGYGAGLAASAPAIRVDIVANYEATPSANYLDYIPSAYYRGDIADRTIPQNIMQSSIVSEPVGTTKNHDSKGQVMVLKEITVR